MDVLGYSFLLLLSFWFAFSYIVIVFATIISIVAVPRKSIFVLIVMAVFRLLYLLYLIGFGYYIVFPPVLYGYPVPFIIYTIPTVVYGLFTVSFIYSSLVLCKTYIQERKQSTDVQYSVVDMDVYNVQSI